MTEIVKANRINIIGAGEVGCATSIGMDKNTVYKTNSFYWDENGNEYLGAVVLPLYGAFVTEEKYQLFGDVRGKKMLEIGCGNGQSMQYHGDSNASELWGIDISEKQIEKGKTTFDIVRSTSKFDLLSHGRRMWHSKGLF